MGPIGWKEGRIPYNFQGSERPGPSAHLQSLPPPADREVRHEEEVGLGHVHVLWGRGYLVASTYSSTSLWRNRKLTVGPVTSDVH